MLQTSNHSIRVHWLVAHGPLAKLQLVQECNLTTVDCAHTRKVVGNAAAHESIMHSNLFSSAHCHCTRQFQQPGQDRLSGKLLRFPKPIIEIVHNIHAMTFVNLSHLICGHLCNTNGHCMLLSFAIDGDRLTCFCLQTQT